MASDHESVAADPIVIVGMGCRLPGDLNSPSKLWELLEAQRSAQSSVPKNRFDIDKWYHPDPKRKGGIASLGGYFLSHDDSYRNFDPSFFGINPLEAASMDPQQRKLLEVVYETFESAGATLDQISGSQTACYVGAFTADFNKTVTRDAEEYFPYESTGSDMTILSNRVNYVFNLKGPSLTVDTACSSSLYALHLACQSLRLGDCDAAIVGGTNIIMDVQHQLIATKLGILSATSTCHTFDDSADGFGRAEGITALYIKRLSDAIANKDPIRAIIQATAINTNGKGHGISHPGLLGQEAVIRKAYSKVSLGFEETGYLECHGTGTPVGDPIEVAAIGRVFAEGRTARTPLLLSALKSNIGHTEGASGLASIQKVVLSLEKGVVPATVGVRRLNPAIDFKDGRLKVVCIAEAWPKHLQYRRASVNSFGYGGANAHVILDSALSYFERVGHSISHTWTFVGANSFQESIGCSSMTGNGRIENQTNHTANASLVPSQPYVRPVNGSVNENSTTYGNKYLLISSAHDLPTLEKNITVLSGVVSRCSAVDLAYTFAARRSLFHHRAFTIIPEVVTSSAVEREKWTVGVQKEATPTLAFAFTGQGAQWPRMGLELLNHFPVVHRTFETLQAAMDTVIEPPDWTLLGALSQPPESSRMMMDVTVTVTLCTAVQIAIVDLLESWGVRPKAVVGHSSGEAAAAYSVGLLTAAEAVVTSYYRALAIVKQREPGAMMAVGLGASETQCYLNGHGKLYLACHNSPESVTVSGDADAIDQLGKALSGAGIFARRIMSSGNANHSPMVARAAQYFNSTFKDSLPSRKTLSNRTPKAPMYSCITSEIVRAEDIGIEYWGRNISDPVLFNQAAQNLFTFERSVDHIVEIGPHSALAGPIRQIKSALGFSNDRLMYLPSLVRGNNGVDDMLRLAGSLFLAGYVVDVVQINSRERTSQNGIIQQTGRHLVDLPPYQWNYDQMYWVEGRLTRELRFRKHPRHDLLGSREPGSSLLAPLWRNKLQLKDVPWISDHKIGNAILFPASGYIAMALEAVRQMAADSGTTPKKFMIQRVSIFSPIALSGDAVVETLFNLRAIDGALTQASATVFDFKISSVSVDGKWSQHASGMVAYDDTQTFPKSWTISSESPPAPTLTDSSERDCYSRFRDVGLNYGPTFQTLRNIRRISEGGALAQIAMHSTKEVMPHESNYIVHPATLDGCLQLSFLAAEHGHSGSVPRAYLPVEVRSLTVWGWATPLENFAAVKGHGNTRSLRSVESSFKVAGADGRPLVEADVAFLSVEGGFGTAKEEVLPQPYQRLEWLPDVDQLHGSKSGWEFSNLGRDASVRDSMDETQTQKEFLLCLRKFVRRGKETADGSEMGSELLKRSQRGLPSVASLMSLYKLVKLITFKDPGLRILEIGIGCSLTSATIILAAGGSSTYSAYSSFISARSGAKVTEAVHGQFNFCKKVRNYDINLEEDLAEVFPENSVALLVITDLPSITNNPVNLLKRLKTLLAAGGRLVILNSDPQSDTEDAAIGRHGEPVIPATVSLPRQNATSKWHGSLLEAGYSGVRLEIDHGAVLMSSTDQLETGSAQQESLLRIKSTGDLWLVYQKLHPLIRVVESVATQRDIKTHCVHISNTASIPRGARVLMLAELEVPLLSRVSESELVALQGLFKQPFSIVWVTRGQNPELSLIQGMAKVIGTEYPNLQLSCIDLDATGGDLSFSAEFILQQELRLRENPPNLIESPIIEKDTIAHISRYIVDEEENMNDLCHMRPVIADGKFEPGLSLDMLHVGQVGSYFFRAGSAAARDESVARGSIVVSPRLYGLAKQEAMILRGQTISSSFSHECLGVVARVPTESRFKPGEFVICLKPGKFDSELVVSEKLCVPWNGEAQSKSAVGILMSFCTALHALLDIGRVRKGEAVLIDAPGDPLSIAACQVAQRLGAMTLVMYASQAEKDYLQHHCEIEAKSLISADTADLQHHLMTLTSSRGVDIVISTSNADLRTVWRCLAPNGRLILTGSNVKSDVGLLDVAVFSRGASISSFNLSNMLESDVDEVARLFQMSFEFVRTGFSANFPSPVQYDINELEAAVKSVVQRHAYGRAGLNCGPESIIPLQRAPRTPLKFRSDSSYLLVGCLGGLGRSLALWMKDRGAMHFIFLSRSADDKPEAAALVKDLRVSSKDATVTVVRGDVTIREDVERAVSVAKCPIRGVIQAAVVFQDSLFSSMTLDTFNAVVQPKVHGTLNLHEATLKLEQPLDFFVMTSSTIGVIGASTQSHYAAANIFLDHMARHRWSLGLQATSLSLGMVLGIGHVNENAEIEDALRKRRSYGISETEYLRMMELACRPRNHATQFPSSVTRAGWKNLDPLGQSLIVTGLDPTKFTAPDDIMASEQLTPDWIRNDTRLRHITHAMAQVLGPSTTSQKTLNQSSSTTTDPTSNAQVLSLLSTPDIGESSLRTAVQSMILHKLSALVLVPVDKLTASLGRPLSELGMDSIIGAEFRTWAWHELRAELEFMQVLEGGRSLEWLVETVWDGVRWVELKDGGGLMERGK